MLGVIDVMFMSSALPSHWLNRARCPTDHGLPGPSHDCQDRGSAEGLVKGVSPRSGSKRSEDPWRARSEPDNVERDGPSEAVDLSSGIPPPARCEARDDASLAPG